MNYQEIINDVSSKLGINVPEFEMTSNNICGSKTCLAAADCEHWSIIVKNAPLSYDIIFSIAHECRHLWQSRNGWDLSSAKAPKELSNRDYNLQKHEIDANAFGVVYLSQFGVKPLFRGLDEDVKRIIYMQAELMR